MPERDQDQESGSAPVRSFWSGTITFGLVSIPVDLFSAARPRQKSMKLVDTGGHALGRRYHCSKEGKKLAPEEIVRGFETEEGEVIVITDEELESVAPETSRDIELRRFVPLEQIPAMHFDRPYFLAPAGRSAKAYNLLAKTMERTRRVAIGTFVMRGHEYLIAILSENGVLRAETLRHADEIRTPEYVGLRTRPKAQSKKVNEFVKDIEALFENKLNIAELEDRDVEALQQLAHEKEKKGEDVIEQSGLEEEQPEEGGAQIIDLMQVLRRSLAKNAVVTTARDSETAPAGSDRRPPRRASSRTKRPRAAPAKKRATAKTTKRKTQKAR